MNLENISEGLVVGNYKKLCGLLDITPKQGGDELKAQKKEIKRYLDYKRIEGSHKIAITQIYSQPLPVKDNRSKGGKSKYREHIEKSIVYLLSNTADHEMVSTAKYYYQMLGMANPAYLRINDSESELESEFDFYRKVTEQELANFLTYSWTLLNNTFLNNMRNLHKRKIIVFEERIIVVEDSENNLTWVASPTQEKAIKEIEKKSLEALGFKDRTHARFKRKSFLLNSFINDMLNQKYGWERCYKVYYSSLPRTNDYSIITVKEFQQEKLMLNRKIVEKFIENMQNRYDKTIAEFKKKTEEKNNRACFGKPNPMERVKAYEPPLDYMELYGKLTSEYLKIV